MTNPGFVDLWRGKAYTVEGAGEDFCLYLQPSETLLVIKEGAGFCGENRAAEWYKAEYPDWTGRFELAARNENSAEYVLKIQAPETAQAAMRFSRRHCVRACGIRHPAGNEPKSMMQAWLFSALLAK